MKERGPNRAELLNVWAESQSALRLALDALKRSVAHYDFEQIEEFLEHNENGLAFEDLAHAAQSECAASAPVFTAQMKIAADWMKLPVGKRFGF